MKIALIALLSLVIILHFTAFAQQEPPPESFFPSAVGNVWEYDTPSGIEKYKINGDSIAPDNSLFLFFNRYPSYRIDTNYNVFSSPSGLNWLKYKLDADSGECWTYVPGIGRDEKVGRIDSIYLASVFGEVRVIKEIDYYFVGVIPFKMDRKSKNFNFFNSLVDSGYICGKDITCYCFDKDTMYTYESTIILVEGIGEYYEFTPGSGGGPPDWRILRGAIINGDTLGTITLIDNNRFEIPDHYKLYQNFPNPFNPSTIISFQLAVGSNVILRVYDILGNEITVLVDEYKKAGKYSVTFNASNLSSGIYICTLRAGKYFASKKMIIAK